MINNANTNIPLFIKKVRTFFEDNAYIISFFDNFQMINFFNLLRKNFYYSIFVNNLLLFELLTINKNKNNI